MKNETLRDIALFFGTIAMMFACGCTTRSQHVALDGMFVSEAGTFAIGSIEVQSAPEGVESAMVSYEDDTSWFSDAKSHSIRILLTGTNSVASADGIVSNICAAFVATAPIVANASSTNRLTAVMK